MRHVAVVALTLALAASDVVLLGQGPTSSGSPPTSSRAARATASVVGRVLAAGMNAPVRRAEVRATTRGRAPVMTTTDDEGRYRLDLPAGDWQVIAMKDGWVAWQFGQTRPFETPPPIALQQGQQFTADIPLTRGGVIAGRVYGEFGEPLAGLEVRAYRGRMEKGYRRLETVGAADLTDDNGAFRIFALPPGDYYIAGSLRVAPVGSVVQTTYAPTYYPGTGDLAEAQRIRLGLGSEVSASFPLLPVRRSRVSGVVLSSSGGPANAFLNLESEATELGVPLGVGGVTRSDGTFTLPDVAPGRYILSASLRGDGPDESASIPVVVSGGDVGGLTLVTGRPATLLGTVVADAGVTRRLPGNLDVVATAARSGLVLGSGSGTAFQIDALTGPFHLSVDGLPEPWTVKDIVVSGLSAIDNAIELGHGEQAEARVVLTDRLTEITGEVQTGANRQVDVVVFPDDSTKWGPRSRHLRATQTDEQGRFRMAGLPPGERYLAIATDYLEEGEHSDPEFLAGMRDFAVSFSLQEGQTRTVDLKVIER